MKRGEILSNTVKTTFLIFLVIVFIIFSIITEPLIVEYFSKDKVNLSSINKSQKHSENTSNEINSFPEKKHNESLQAFSLNKTNATREPSMDETKSENLISYSIGEGYIKEINWTNYGKSNRIVLDEKQINEKLGIRTYLHSDSLGNGWSYKDTLGKTTTEENKDIQYKILHQSNDSFSIESESKSIQIRDYAQISPSEIKFTVRIKNKLNKKITASIPFNFGPLQIDDSTRYRLRATKGGYIQDWRGKNAKIENPYNYPEQIQTYSPVSVLWDKDITIGEQFLTEIYLPDNIEFKEIPSRRYSEMMISTINTELQPLQIKEFIIIFKFSEGGDWQDALLPYKKWFYETYGSKPSYCPTGPFAFFAGVNSCQNNNPELKAERPHCYNESIGDYRFIKGTKLSEIYLGKNNEVLDIMEEIGLENYGIWRSTIYSSYITKDGSTLEHNPNIDLIDPNIDAGPNPEKIKDFTDKFHSRGLKVFWFARPCANIYGADIKYDSSENPIIIKGTPSGYKDVDLTKKENIEEAFRKLDFFVSRGVDGFYLDATSCKGDTEFIKYAKTEFKKKYNKDIFMIKEGARDRDSLLWPQITLIKLPDYEETHSSLIEFLVPSGTYYAGKINQHLSDEELEKTLEKGYMPIISGSLFHPDSNQNKEKWIKWIQKGKSNMQETEDILSC